ncbi:hypothetical protein GH714_029718 [Hevea brasiliensis]|uniref:V-ATPase proteolipid subunit C-like domain-containing protein n=1 Tax=Hevea brasiliensis TaxID=3981 RepID=A0A6A6LFC3_HEVBR|nr:hypothetical protein GH714_029718 [Hevea brasiliensis]
MSSGFNSDDITLFFRFFDNSVVLVFSCMGAAYGAIKSGVVIISNRINPEAKPYYLFDEYANFSSGLACGLSRLFAGMVIGIIGDVNVIANA